MTEEIKRLFSMDREEFMKIYNEGFSVSATQDAFNLIHIYPSSKPSDSIPGNQFFTLVGYNTYDRTKRTFPKIDILYLNKVRTPLHVRVLVDRSVVLQFEKEVLLDAPGPGGARIKDLEDDGRAASKNS